MKHFIPTIVILTMMAACTGMAPPQSAGGNAGRAAGGAESRLIKMDKDLKGLSVGLWVTPPSHLLQTNEDIEREYGRIKDAGMNMVWGFWDYGENLGNVLDVCGRIGVDYILPLPVNRDGEGDLEAEINRCLNIVKAFKDYPAVIGFNMIDEPSAVIFNRLGEIRRTVDAILPATMYTIANLHPNYAPPGYFGTETYEDYVEQYMLQVKPKILSVDHYPFSINPSTDNYASFIENLLIMRETSFKYNIPFWGFIQAIGWEAHREPTYSELRWLNNMHVLFGAKGYSYYLYSAIGPDEDYDVTTAALTWDGRITSLYDRIKSINAEFSAFDRLFVQFTQNGFIPVNMDKSFLDAFNSNLLNTRYGRLASIKTNGTMLNGCFDFEGQKAVYLFNWSMDEPMTATLAFDGRTVYELWGKGGLEASGTGRSFKVKLEAGESKFLIFE